MPLATRLTTKSVLFFAALSGLILSSCGGGIHCAQSGRYQDNDPLSVCTVDCNSAQADSDAVAHIEQTGPNAFAAGVTQTRPAAANRRFTLVTAGWSGHFFNFQDATSGLPLKFHMLTRGSPTEGNLELYTDDNTLGGGPVGVQSLNCTIVRN
jgi:hypothetical protein